MTKPNWGTMSRAERDAAYNNAAAVAESAQHIARWTAAHCSALETMRHTVNICASTLDAPTGHSSPSTGRKPRARRGNPAPHAIAMWRLRHILLHFLQRIRSVIRCIIFCAKLPTAACRVAHLRRRSQWGASVPASTTPLRRD